MALTKLTSNLIEGGTGTDWVTAIQTSNFTAAAGKGYFVNTTSQVLYVNLPVGVVGMEITIQDYAGTFGTNKVILNANGSEKIQGSALEGKINTNNATAVLIYQDATKGWTSQDVSLNATTISWDTPTGQSLTYSTPSPQSSQGAAAATFPTTTFTATKAGKVISGTATIAGLPTGITAAQAITGSGAGNTLTVTLTGTFPAADYINTNLTLSGLTVITPLTVDYLVVAGGGGGGGDLSGGGGAGGYLTNYGATALTLSVATNYLVTTGAGGRGGIAGSTRNTENTRGGDGSNSVFYNITATGGGGGGVYGDASSSLKNGRDGGSGGGAGAVGTSAGSGGVATSSPTQGNNGGLGFASPPYSGGGGGGAGAVGQNAPTGNQGGNGGIGLTNAITVATGTGPYYAGGGGGSNYGGTTPGGGGSGGGGTGGYGSVNPGGIGGNGTANTGGGGGGGSWNGVPTTGGAGGSGIVILRYPSGYVISGLSGTTTTVGSDKVTTFTNVGTGNIQFN